MPTEATLLERKKGRLLSRLSRSSDEARKAVLIAWLILSAGTVLALAAPFWLSPETIALLTPDCVWKSKFNKPCLFCGMTRSFIMISDGHLAQAQETNRYSILVYIMLVLNDVIAGACLVITVLRNRQCLSALRGG